MNKQEKIQFIKELSNTIVQRITEQIESDKIPENWQGKELRILLKYRHSLSAGRYGNSSITRKVNKVIKNNSLWE